MKIDNINLRKRVLQGAYWTTGLNFGGQIITWLVTIFVIRLLTPQDYGLMAMAMVLIGFLVMLSEIGLGPAVIQKQDISDRHLRQILGCVVIICVAICGIVILSAPLVSLYFSEPRVVPIIRVLSINFILISFYFLPQAMVTRELEFRKKATINLIANLTASAIVLSCALLNLGVWALVLGQIGMNISKVIMYGFIKKYRVLPIFSFKGIGNYIGFGGYVTLSRILWYVYSQADVIIGGRLLGKQLLGLYTISIQLISLPMLKISPIITQIGFPAFSRIQENLAAVQENFKKLVKLVNTISFPCFFGVMMIAPQAVPLLLGDKWSEAVVPIQLLSIVMPLRFLDVLFGPVITGKGRPEIMTGNMVLANIIMPTAFLIGVQWGVVGLCYAWVAAYPFLFILMLVRVLRVLEISVFSFFKEAVKPLISSLLMVAGLYLANFYVNGINMIAGLFIFILLGASIYVTAMVAFDRHIFRKIKAMLSPV